MLRLNARIFGIRSELRMPKTGLTVRALWQVRAGDIERKHDDVCLKWDVMMAGPGWPGECSEERPAQCGDMRNSVRRFCQGAKNGDPVLLRVGSGQVIAVVIGAGDRPQLLDAFSHIDGWELQHVRRVRWLSGTARQFPSKTLGGQVRTFTGVNISDVRAWVATNEFEASTPERALTAMPNAEQRLERSDLGRPRFVAGLPSERLGRLMDTICSLDRVASWYSNKLNRQVRSLARRPG